MATTKLQNGGLVWQKLDGTFTSDQDSEGVIAVLSKGDTQEPDTFAPVLKLTDRYVLPGNLTNTMTRRLQSVGLIYGDFDGTTTSTVGNPTVLNVVPATGTALVPTASIQFDVTDTITLGLFRRVILVAQFTNAYEVIHNGVGFGPGYSGTQTAITNGFRYVVTRTGGWPQASLVVVPYAIDTFGTENT